MQRTSVEHKRELQRLANVRWRKKHPERWKAARIGPNKAYRSSPNGKEKRNATERENYALNIEKERARQRVKYLRLKEKKNAKAREQYALNRTEKIAEAQARRNRNREHVRARQRKRQSERLKTDLGFKLIMRCRSRMHLAIKRAGYMKTANVSELFGCEKDFLIGWLEAGFKPGMSWENYGREGWHVDHVKPCAAFDLSDPAQQRQCFHFTNLQPLWASENMSKGRHLPTSP